MAKKSNGFTLIEILIALVILSMGIVMLITMFTVGMDGVVANQKRTQATNLAQDLMDEIMGKNFDETSSGTAPGNLGPELGESSTDRSTWDDVDDYLGLESGESPPRDAVDNELTSYNDFTRYASVWYVQSTDLNTPEITNSTELKRISVWVSHSEISDVVVIDLKTRFISSSNWQEIY